MTIYKTKIKKLQFGALIGAGSKLAGTVGKVSDVASKVAPIASAVGQMLPNQEVNPNDPLADRKQEIKAGKEIFTEVVGTAGDFIIPGSSSITKPVLKAIDSVGEFAKEKGGTAGQYGNALLNPTNVVNQGYALAKGDISGFAEAFAPAIAANELGQAVGLGKLYGEDSLLGESDASKLMKQAKINAVTTANLAAQKNNAGANARYVKQGGSINRILRASKGLSFQLGLIPSKQNEFKIGGVLPSYHDNKNVILAGVLHKDDHNICELEDKSCGVIYGKKGIPVVSNNQKVAEIEKEELVFTKEVAKQIDVLVTKYNKTKSNDVKLEIGKYIYEQLHVNTIDNTKI